MRKTLALVCVALCAAAVPARPQAPAQPNPKDYTAHVVGYAHIDLAWLWRWEESIHDIMYNTFRNQLDLMNQYPDFTFAQDQAMVYEMTERYQPDIFKEIVQRVKTRNWIPVSSGYTQMDENMPDGESLVRQFLYGQKYTKEKFGRYVRVAWQPDVFGHPASMPQIARKAGIEFFLFGRPHDAKRPPIFWWEALDGTRVLGYNPPGWYTQPIGHDYTTTFTLRDGQRMGVKDLLVLYGKGDHGGGPNPTDVAGIAQLNASPNDVKVKTSHVEDYFDLLLTVKRDFPVIPGEHNPVFEGCYTSQFEMKRNNRLAEQLLLTAEKFSVIAVASGYRDFYPSRDVTEAWKLTLLNQTHDLLPGSGIGPIYQDAAKQYQEVFERGKRALEFSLQTIGLQLNTQGEGVPLVVYNPHSWDRTDLVVAEISAPSLPSAMVAVHGTESVGVQVLKAPARQDSRQKATIAFVAQSVPQMGLKLYRILPASAKPATVASTLRAGTSPRPFLENEFFRVEFSPTTGNISRLFDKKNNREALKGEGNFLVALEDTAEQARKVSKEYAGPAWDLGLTGVKWDVDKAARVEVTEQGPARATVRVVQRFRDSEFTRDISLLAGVPRVDVKMGIDWYERSTFLKAGFPVNVASTKIAVEIPYGTIEREQTGAEAVMGKWVDISDGRYGVAILNDGRHGYDAKDNVIRLSVIRGPWGPDPRADEGSHSFGYSIYPHAGGWKDAKVAFRALEFNAPLAALQEPAHHSPQEVWAGKKGGLPDSYSFLKVNSDHVILYAAKQMEGFYDTDPILRFVETEGREGEVSLQVPFTVRAVETDLLEETIGPVGEGETIRFRMKPWEIKSLRLSRVQRPGPF
jgi:alpha-mannosidase